MGVFDYVRAEIPCWKCGRILKGWQSKSGKCSLSTLEIGEVSNFYTGCDDEQCGAWNEWGVEHPKDVYTLVPLDGRPEEK